MDLDLSQVRQTFITESRELLQDMENSLLALENAPDDSDTINTLFRSAHTIKGSSGIVGIESVERFTHVVENLLSKVREGQLRINGDIIELLLKCRDHISALVDIAAAETDVSADLMASDAALRDKLNRCLGASPEAAKEVKKDAPKEVVAVAEGGAIGTGADLWHISLRFSPNVLRFGMDPAAFISYLSKLGEVVSLTTLYDSMPTAPEMDPEACYLGFEIAFLSDFDKKTIEDVFEFVRDECAIHILPPHSRVESYVELIKELPEDTALLGDILVKSGVLTKEELEGVLLAQKQEPAEKGRIGEILVNSGMVHAEVVDAALEKQKQTQIVKSKEASTIRIDAAKLDSLVNLVGELVISSANIEQHAQRIKDGGLLESASIMLRLVEEVRENTMKARMVPIGETFNRFNRVVRDIGKDTGKEIELEINGGETELDKTVTEKINDPLMHLVRNSADHGIERPEERIAAGKPAKGTVRLNAFQDAGSIVIEVSDDGKGLNRKKIHEKALAKGIIAHGQTITDGELLRLIFAPGFSTAEKVTNLSGRGVGMDVVKRNIESLRGTVDVESTDGVGAVVRIRLPLTLAIIDGFMVGIGEQNFVIPLDSVVECVEFSAADKQASGSRNYINLRGEILPYIKLREFLGEEGEKASVFENIVVIQYAGTKVGFVVDELYGEVQTVVKSLGRAYKDVQGISGATILGNGRVALILDVPRLVMSVEKEINAAL